MSAYFRVSGKHFDVDAFLAESSLDPDMVFYRGQQDRIASGKKCPFTGFGIRITPGFGRLRAHTTAVTAFLRNNKNELRRLSGFRGVTEMSLDFGYERCPDAAVQCDYLPPPLVSLAGSLGIGIALSLYPAPANRGKRRQRQANRNRN